MIIRAMLLSAFLILLIIDAGSQSSPFSSCKDWKSCKKTTTTSPISCTLSYKYKSCDDNDVLGSASCTDGINCQDGCTCACDSQGYSISYFDTCSNIFRTESRYCNGCGPIEE